MMGEKDLEQSVGKFIYVYYTRHSHVYEYHKSLRQERRQNFSMVNYVCCILVQNTFQNFSGLMFLSKRT